MSKKDTVKSRPASAAGSVDHAEPNFEDALQQLVPGTESSAQDATGDLRRQMIAAAAYYRAEQRGFAPGCELEDWVVAEAEVDARLSSATK